MSKRERIFVGTTVVLAVLCIALIVTMFIQKPSGSVDIGHGYTVSRAEFDEYSAMAEQTTKDILLELKIAEDAAKELGVTITDEQIQQEVDSMNLIYNYEKGTGEYCDLKLHASIALIEQECVEHFKKKINPTEDEIATALAGVSDKLMVDCEYKNISTLDGVMAKAEKTKFEDIDSKYEIIDAGSETAISVNKQEGMEVGGTYVQENGENYAVFKITKIYSTDAEKRDGTVYKLKEQKAESEFYTYISDYYEKKMSGTDTTNNETQENLSKTDESVDTAGNKE